MSHSQLPVHISHLHIRRSKWSGKTGQTFNPERSLQQERSSLDHISMDPNGFNPRSHERGIDGSTTSETSLTSFLKLLAAEQLCPFLKLSRSQGFKKKLDKSHHHQKKIQDPLLPQNTKDDEKKILKIQKHRIKKKASKKIHKIRLRKKNQQKPYKNQKVSGKSRKPTTSFINQQGRKD